MEFTMKNFLQQDCLAYLYDLLDDCPQDRQFTDVDDLVDVCFINNLQDDTLTYDTDKAIKWFYRHWKLLGAEFQQYQEDKDFASDTNPFENPEGVMLQLVIQVCKQYLWDNLDDIYSSNRWENFTLTDDRLKDLKRCMSVYAD